MKLEELLNEGLGVWISEWKQAKQNGDEYFAEIIKEGIDLVSKDLDFEDQSQLQEMLEDDHMYKEFLINPVKVNEAKQMLLTEEQRLNESFLRRAIGAAGGFAFGPALGEVIAEVFGAERDGLLYDFLTSRLFGAAIGSAVAKRFG